MRSIAIHRIGAQDSRGTRVDGIEDSVVFDEQKTIDLHYRHVLIKQKLNAADFMDRSLSAIFDGASDP